MHERINDEIFFYLFTVLPRVIRWSIMYSKLILERKYDEPTARVP